MSKKLKKNIAGEPIVEKGELRGFFRLQIEEGNKVVGDSGWQENQITNLGVQNFLIEWLIGNTASGVSVTHMALGSGGVPAASDTTLSGEVVKRQAVTASITSFRTAQFTAQFASANSFVTNTQNISNVGLFNSSSTGSLFAGNTFASSSCATNQNVNATYQIRFS